MSSCGGELLMMLKRHRLLMVVSLLSATAISTLVAMPARATTIVVTDQSQFDAAIQVAIQPGQADTIDATAAGVIDAGASLTLPGAATSTNLEFGTLGIGATVGNGSVTLGPTTTVSFGQPGNPGALNMGAGYTGVLNINGASLTFNVSDANEQFNVGLDDGTAIVNMTSGAITMNDSTAIPGNFGSISIAFPFASSGHQANATFNQSGGTVSLSTGALNIGVADGNGFYNLSNDALVQLGGGTSYIGATSQGVGILNVTGAATFDFESFGTAGQLYVGDDLGNGTITQNGANSTVILNVANIAQFGSNASSSPDGGGTGTYNLLAGTAKIGGLGAAFGMDAGGVGFLNQSGGNVIASALIIIGNSGTGTYNMSGGAANFGDGLTVAVLAGSTGTVTQTGGLVTISGGRLNVGTAGTATYDLSGGVLQVGGTNGITGTGALNLGGGTLQVIGAALTTNMAIGLTGASSTIDTNGLGATLGGVMSGGGFVKAGLGTLSVTAANIYTGGTAISGGTLQIGNGGTSGSIVGDVVDNGALAFDRTDGVAFAGAISGAGIVEQNGTGGLTLTGANSYSGGTALNAGTLIIANAGGIGSGMLAMAEGTTLGFGGSFDLANAITVSGDPMLDVGAGQTVTASGGISDGTSAGDIVKTGTGTLILTAANTYTGGTTISAGTLQLGNGETSGSIVGNVVDSGALIFDRSDSVVFGGAISGGGSIDQAGAGTLTLSGNSSAFTGSTEVTSGTLAVTGVLGAALAWLRARPWPGRVRSERPRSPRVAHCRPPGPERSGPSPSTAI
jgi:fibronectin-binding autotransporter adhesin